MIQVAQLEGPLSLFNKVNVDTLVMAWAAMAVVLVIAFIATRNLSLVPGRMQVVGEGMYDFCRSLTHSTAGDKGDGYLFFIGSLFFFILAANLMGQLPVKLLPWNGELIAATGDFNVPAALALTSLFAYLAIGIKRKGLSYFKHYVFPHPLFLPFNLLEDVTRPFSLMLRLYANILVGEILSMIALKLVPFILPAGVICMEIFVGVVQAFIFAILSAVYIALMAAESHDH